MRSLYRRALPFPANATPDWLSQPADFSPSFAEQDIGSPRFDILPRRLNCVRQTQGLRVPLFLKRILLKNRNLSMTTRKSFNRSTGSNSSASTMADPRMSDANGKADTSRLPSAKSTNGVQDSVDMSDPLADFDYTSPESIDKLRKLFSEEYGTLAARQNELLLKYSGQFVLIHKDHYEVHPTMDEALSQGYSRFGNRVFFVGKIDPKEIEAYLQA